MARPLVTIALTGIAVSVASFLAAGIMITTAVADGLSLPDFLAWGGDKPRCPEMTNPANLQETHELAWNNGTGVGLAISATLHYRPGANERIILRGPRHIIDHVELVDSNLALDCRPRGGAPDIEIEMAGDRLRNFSLFGSGNMILEDLAEDEISISIAGSGSVRASGTADEVEISIAGSGDADAGAIDARRVQVSIAGSGDAIVAPRENLDVSSAGSGDVRLLTDPDNIDSSMFGSGRIIGPARTN